MSETGIGVMIRRLAGYEKFDTALIKGKTIASAEITNDDVLVIGFCDRSELRVRDDGQSCCEHRYMQTDDDLASYAGATLEDIEIADAPDVDNDGEVHEVQFMRVATSNGTFTVASHNQHNGYYGGFSVEASYTPAPEQA